MIFVVVIFLGLKIYNLNGIKGRVVLSHTIHLKAQWKDRDIGTGPVIFRNILSNSGNND